jgi:hypothetical protein
LIVRGELDLPGRKVVLYTPLRQTDAR